MWYATEQIQIHALYLLSLTIHLQGKSYTSLPSRSENRAIQRLAWGQTTSKQWSSAVSGVVLMVAGTASLLCDLLWSSSCVVRSPSNAAETSWPRLWNLRSKERVGTAVD
jgi:hypothetical protein